MKPLYEENDHSPAEPTDDVLRAQDAEEFKGEVYEQIPGTNETRVVRE